MEGTLFQYPEEAIYGLIGNQALKIAIRDDEITDLKRQVAALEEKLRRKEACECTCTEDPE